MPPTRQPTAPSVSPVEVRVRASVEVCALLTGRLRTLPGLQVLSESTPRPDQDGDQVRVYLRARLTSPPPARHQDDDGEIPASEALTGALTDAAAEITAARSRLAAALAAVTAAEQLHHDTREMTR
jgi:hypothetical protein